MSEFEYPKAILLNGSSGNEPEKQIDYWGLFSRFILRRWYIYLFFGLLSMTMAYFYYKQKQPVYAITSKLMIRERKQEYGPAEDLLQKNLNFSATSEEAINEIQLLTSYSLMTSIVEKLGFEKQYIWKVKGKEFEAYQGFPIAVDTFHLNVIEDPTFTIVPLNSYSFRFLHGKRGNIYHFGKLFSNRFGTFQISKTGTIPGSADSTIQVSFLNSKAIARNYLENLSVELSDAKNNSSVIILTLRDAIPQRGIDLLENLIEKYNRIKSEANTEITLKTLELIDNRLDNISAELASAESSVESYKLRNDIFSETTSDLDITLQDVNDLVNEQRNLEFQLHSLTEIKADLADTSSKTRQIPLNPSLYEGKLMESILPYNEAVSERERLLINGKSSNPVLQANNQKLKSLRSSINSTIDHMQSDLGQKLGKLQSQYNKSFSRLRRVPIKERGLSDKLRIQSVKENLFVYLLQKREETALALVSNYNNAMLVDAPYSTLNPVGPSKVKIFAGAAFGGGIAFPFMVVLLLELLMSPIRTENDIKGIFPQKSILGVIGQNKAKNDQLLVFQDRNLVMERFRALRTNLQFYSRENSRCILITSSTVNEGKTFVASNLATSFALAKRKVVIVDFDLRKPSINRYFKGNPEIGLSNYFLGELNVDEIVQTAPELPNLHFISGGPVMPYLLEMVNESNLDGLFDFLKSNYEIVVLDTSPIGIISDSILLNKYVDKSLFVIRSGYTKKGMVEKAKEIFEQNKLVNPSIIFNGVKKRDDKYGYSYKQYGYS